ATGGGDHSDLAASPAGPGPGAPLGPYADGGHAGIVCSVGGWAGWMSLCVGRGASGWSFGGQVSGADRTGSAGGEGSGSPAVSAGAGTVCAHEGAGFCIGTAGFGVDSSTPACSAGEASVDGSVCAQDGAGFCIGSADFGPASVAASGSSAPAVAFAVSVSTVA